MGELVIKLPDVGEGVAEAELVGWHVKIGDFVHEDTALATVMTNKVTVEIPSPVDGEILWLGAEIGDTVAVGSPMVRIQVAGDTQAPESAAESKPEAQATEHAKSTPAPTKKEEQPAKASTATTASITTLKSTSCTMTIGLPCPEGERPLASPAVRQRAKEASINLRQIAGTGPAGRITNEDLDAFAAGGDTVVTASLQKKTDVEEIKVVGLRRRIAEKMTMAKSRIPHITYVEEVDVTALEELRAKLNAAKKPDRAKLTILPLLMRALVKTVAEQPQINAIYDDDAGVIQLHAGVYIGMATQTPGGLVVPVVKHAEARDLWDCAAEVNRLAAAAKAGTATRDELTGSTITITSLGVMGGVATTPVINYPEVAIVGVNKIMIRPMWEGTQFVPRKMMNLSSSFDHRVIDGWDAAVFVQRLKTLLETPAMIFVEG